MEELHVASLVVAATFRIAVPYVFAALGGYFSERTGIVNIALEGMLLSGAFACVVAAHAAESAGLAGAVSAWIGVGAALGVGALADVFGRYRPAR